MSKSLDPEKNADSMKLLLSDVRRKLNKIKLGGGRKNIEKQHAKGKMTAREVLQYVGTDIFRKMNHNVWINSFFSKVKSDNSEVALVSDVRFTNEIQQIQENGGYVLGLTRDIYKGGDSHSSESELDEALSMCDTIIDNSNLTLAQQNEKIYRSLEHLENVLPSLVPPKS